MKTNPELCARVACVMGARDAGTINGHCYAHWPDGDGAPWTPDLGGANGAEVLEWAFGQGWDVTLGGWGDGVQQCTLDRQGDDAIEAEGATIWLALCRAVAEASAPARRDRHSHAARATRGVGGVKTDPELTLDQLPVVVMDNVSIAGYENVPCVSSTFELASEVAGELAADADCGWAFVWWQNSDGSYTASLRSRGEVEVNKIAEQFGGGGHPGAAGFRCETPVWK